MARNTAHINKRGASAETEQYGTSATFSCNRMSRSKGPPFLSATMMSVSDFLTVGQSGMRDPDSIVECVQSAYEPYVELMGREPALMLDEMASGFLSTAWHATSIEHLRLHLLRDGDSQRANRPELVNDSMRVLDPTPATLGEAGGPRTVRVPKGSRDLSTLSGFDRIGWTSRAGTRTEFGYRVESGSGGRVSPGLNTPAIAA